MTKRVFSWLPPKDIRHMLLVYFIAFLIITTLLMPIYLYANKLFVQSETERYQTLLNTGVEKLSQTVQGIYNAAYFTCRSATFLPLRYYTKEELNPVSLEEQQTIFKGYIIQQEAILEAGLVFAEDLVITTNWIFYPQTAVKFYPALFRCKDFSFSQWQQKLQENAPGFLPSMDYYTGFHRDISAITYTVKWGVNAYMYALIRTEDLLAMFLKDENLSGTRLTLTKNDGTIIYSYNDHLPESHYQFNRHISGSGLTATLEVSDNIIDGNIHALRRMIVSYLLIVLILVLTLMVILALFTTFKPLHNLLQRLPDTDSSSAHTLHGSYQVLADGITEMNQKISSQRAVLKSQLLDIALLRGYLSSKQKEIISRLLPNFPLYYRLVLYRLSGNLTEESMFHAMELCEASFPDSYLHQWEHDGFLLVIDTDIYHFQEVARLQETISRETQLKVRVSASEIFEGIDRLYSAWQQLRIVESCSLQSNLEYVYTTRDLPEKLMPMPLSIQDLETIYTALNAADLTLALTVLERCTDFLLKRDDNTLLFHHTYLLLQRMLRQLQLENPTTLGFLNIPAFTTETREEVFLTLLPACMTELCNSLRESRVNRSDSLSAVLEYINQNLISPELCIDSVASHFGISSTTLQKLCQEASGMPVASYIENQRMIKAYQLLLQGKGTVAEVARQCGYNSPNSFYKAFRRKFGIAPRDVAEGRPVNKENHNSNA